MSFPINKGGPYLHINLSDQVKLRAFAIAHFRRFYDIACDMRISSDVSFDWRRFWMRHALETDNDVAFLRVIHLVTSLLYEISI